MTYAHITNGAIDQVRTRPPRSGRLSDGTPVSNLHAADEATLADAGWLPVTDDTQPSYDADQEKVVAAPTSDWSVRTSDVLRTWNIETLPADVDALKLAVLDDTNGLGRNKARQLVRDYPDLLDALNQANWQLARNAIADAHTDGALTDSDHQLLLDLLDAHRIPQPAG